MKKIYSNERIVVLDSDHVALVLTEGSLTLYFPMEGEDDAPPHLLLAAAVSIKLGQLEFQKEMLEFLQDEMRNM